MFAVRLVQLIESHADKLSEGLMRKLEHADQARDLMAKVPHDELKRRTYEIFRNLNEWLVNKTESEVEERYVGLGARRARQGVTFSHLLWAILATKEYLWEHLVQEGLVEQPVELFGELDLLRQLDLFFDRALYYMSVGYEVVVRDLKQREPQALARH